MNSRLLIILGPTSTGKTDVALNLARKFNGELVSCDSRQVYKGLDIGTGKYPNGQWTMDNGQWTMDNGQLKKRQRYWEIDGINIWMYDVVDFKKQYTVFDYVEDANKVIEDIISRDKLPIIVGGTGLYLKGLLKGFDSLSIPVDENIRKGLEVLPLGQIKEKLKGLSDSKWNSLNYSDQQNPRRLIRAIESLLLTSKNRQKVNTGIVDKFNILKIGLTAPKEYLYERSDKRVVARIHSGMIEESEQLHGIGLTFFRMKQLGLEYGLLAEYLQKQIKNQAELIEKMQIKIHQYIKRQLVWYKKEDQVVWFDVAKVDYLQKLEKEVYRWYYQADDTEN